MRNFSHHKVAHWFVDTLDFIHKVLPTHCVNYYFEFFKHSNISMGSNKIWSRDVDSPCMKMPLNETVVCLLDLFLYQTFHFPFALTSSDNLPNNAFNIWFYFVSTLYRQIDGKAIGSALGPTLANAFLPKMAMKLNDCIFKLDLHKRYADNILILNSPTSIANALNHFSSAHPNLLESNKGEGNNCFDVSDIKLTRLSNGTIQRSILRKLTGSGQYL